MFLPRAARACATFLALAGLVLSASTALGQPMPTFVVTASRTPLEPERVVADVVLIDRAAIDASTADSLADLLRREAGVQLSRSGGPGQSSGALIRGAAAVNTVVLVDGVRVGSATLGFAQLDGFSLSQVERVEVLRGPASSLHGADAVGGVVQIFTRQAPAQAGVQAQVGLGGYASREGAISAGGRTGDWDLAAAASGERSRGVSAVRPGDRFGLYNPDDDGYRSGSAQARVGLRFAPGHRAGISLLQSRLQAQFDSAEFAPPTFAADSSGDFRNRLHTQVAVADWAGPLGAELRGFARTAQSVDDLRSGAGTVERFRTQRQHQSLQLEHGLRPGLSATFALERVQEQAQASGFASEPLRRTAGAVLALSGRNAGLVWQADLRRDSPSGADAVTTGRLGLSQPLQGGFRLRALAGTTFRLPSFNDLFYPGYGVPTLRPERGRSLETGLSWQQGASNAALTVYRNRLRDLIGYESDSAQCPADPAYAFGCARNLQRALLQGASVSGQHPLGALNLRGSLELLDASDPGTGRRLDRRAPHQWQLSAQWRQGPWILGSQALRVGARPDAGARLAAETTLDLWAEWRSGPQWRWQLKALNVTDRDLQPARDYQGLGRQVWLVLRRDERL